MTHDDISRIRTDDETLDALGAGMQPGPEDERLVHYAAAYRDSERRRARMGDAFDFFVIQGAERRQKLFTAALCVLFGIALCFYAAGSLLAITLGTTALALAFTLVAGAIALTATALAVFVPKR